MGRPPPPPMACVWDLLADLDAGGSSPVRRIGPDPGSVVAVVAGFAPPAADVAREQPSSPKG